MSEQPMSQQQATSQRHVRVQETMRAARHTLYTLTCSHRFTVTLLPAVPGASPQEVPCELPGTGGYSTYWVVFPLRNGRKAVVGCGHAGQSFLLPLSSGPEGGAA